MDDRKMERLVLENDRLLKKLNRPRILANVLGAVKLLVVVGASVGLYYYIQPFVEQILRALKTVGISIY